MQPDSQETLLVQALQQLDASVRPDFRGQVLQRELTVFEFEAGEETFHLTVTEDDFQFQAGRHPQPTLRLFVPDRDFCFELLTGARDGMQAFLAGDYRSDGHIVLTQLLLYLFLPTQGDFRLVRD